MVNKFSYLTLSSCRIPIRQHNLNVTENSKAYCGTRYTVFKNVNGNFIYI